MASRSSGGRATFLTFPSRLVRFDAVVSVATHHMDREKGLARFADLVKPGGVVAVVGLAANNWWDLPYVLVAHSARLALGFARGHWEHSASTVWPPPATYREMKGIGSRVLPGVCYRRHLLGRIPGLDEACIAIPSTLSCRLGSVRPPIPSWLRRRQRSRLICIRLASAFRSCERVKLHERLFASVPRAAWTPSRSPSNPVQRRSATTIP